MALRLLASVWSSILPSVNLEFWRLWPEASMQSTQPPFVWAANNWALISGGSHSCQRIREVALSRRILTQKGFAMVSPRPTTR